MPGAGRRRDTGGEGILHGLLGEVLLCRLPDQVRGELLGLLRIPEPDQFHVMAGKQIWNRDDPLPRVRVFDEEALLDAIVPGIPGPHAQERVPDVVPHHDLELV